MKITYSGYYKYLAVGSAVITTIVAGIKYMRNRVLDDIDHRIDPKIELIREEHNKLENEVSGIKKMLHFFEQFIVTSKREDSDRDFRDVARDKKYDEGWSSGNNKK